MVDDLATLEGVEAVLAATSTYDVDGDTSMAARHIAALRRRLHFAASMGRDGQSMSVDTKALQDELRTAMAWLRANTTPSEARRLANPDVVHADFSTFRGYHGGDE
mgnify:CR=1 FL=1